jgi:hypothetical protein
MTKRKTRALARSLDADWPPRQPMTLTELITEARAVDWDFANWCYASGHDASDRMPVTCLNACWLTPGARAVPACTDRRPADWLTLAGAHTNKPW